jgi:hypothetical protein
MNKNFLTLKYNLNIYYFSIKKLCNLDLIERSGKNVGKIDRNVYIFNLYY